MPHLLDNPVWFALASGNRELGIGAGAIRFFPKEISPFAGMQRNSLENLETLAAWFSQGEKRFLVDGGQLTLSPLWRIYQKVHVLQMVHTGEVPVISSPHQWRNLGPSDVPAMMELTQITRPGPFAEKTFNFGHYVGFFMDGKLAAMAGQRLNPLPYAEISAVCTHPEFRKRGLAHDLMSHHIRRIRDISQIPFLHVRAESAQTIKLYEALGFSPRKALYVYILERA